MTHLETIKNDKAFLHQIHKEGSTLREIFSEYRRWWFNRCYEELYSVIYELEKIIDKKAYSKIIKKYEVIRKCTDFHYSDKGE
jgi:hypothetical protein